MRASDWWAYKLAPIIGTAYGTALVLGVPLRMIWLDVLVGLVALIVGAAYASFVNDAFDQAEDAAAGKRNHFVGRPRWVAVAALTAIVLMGAIASRPLAGHATALGLYWGNWLVFAAYSMPPLRLKARGLAGVLAIAVGESLVPHLFMMALVAHGASGALPATWICGVSLWAMGCGARSIIWHQLHDADGDRRSGVSTWVVRVTPDRAALLGSRLAFPLELIGLLAMLCVLRSAWAWAALLAYLATDGLRQAWWKVPIIVVRPRPTARLALFEFYEFFLPFAYLAAAVSTNRSDWPLLLVHLLVFPGRLVWWLRDLWGLLRWEAWGRIRIAVEPSAADSTAHPPSSGPGGTH
jgi:hypothetical protein